MHCGEVVGWGGQEYGTYKAQSIRPSNLRIGTLLLHFVYEYEFLLFLSHLSSSPFYSLSLLVVTQIRGHIASPSAPSPLRLAPRTFIARRLQLFLLSPTSVEYYKTEKYIPGTQVHLHSQPNNSATTQTKHTRYIPRHRPVNNLLGRLQQNDNKNNTCQ